jgi:hypothetical protein
MFCDIDSMFEPTLRVGAVPEGMGYVEVRLSPNEWNHAAHTGMMRKFCSFEQKLKSDASSDDEWLDGLAHDILGAAGEVAVSKYLDAFHILTYNNFHDKTDCRFGIEVRTTKLYEGSLIIRPRDVKNCKPETNFVLAVGQPPVMRLMGWINLAESLQQRWWCNKNNQGAAWFVPASALHDIRSIPMIE